MTRFFIMTVVTLMTVMYLGIMNWQWQYYDETCACGGDYDGYVRLMDEESVHKWMSSSFSDENYKKYKVVWNLDEASE